MIMVGFLLSFILKHSLALVLLKIYFFFVYDTFIKAVDLISVETLLITFACLLKR